MKINTAKRIFTMILTILLGIGLVACGTVEPEHKLEYVEGKVITIEERELIGAFCTYTNLSDSACLPCDAINIKAYQNGVEIPVMVFTGREIDGYVQCDTSIQAGATAQVMWLFEHKDNSTVTFEFTDGQSHTYEFATEQ